MEQIRETPPEGYQPQSFLAELLRKRAMVLTLGSSGIKIDGAIVEVDRQIQQALEGNPITGQRVTKSYEEY